LAPHPNITVEEGLVQVVRKNSRGNKVVAAQESHATCPQFQLSQTMARLKTQNLDSQPYDTSYSSQGITPYGSTKRAHTPFSHQNYEY